MTRPVRKPRAKYPVRPLAPPQAQPTWQRPVETAATPIHGTILTIFVFDDVTDGVPRPPHKFVEVAHDG